MLITEDLFGAFADCKTKSFLKLIGTGADRSEFFGWQRCTLDDYKQRCSLRLQASCHGSDEYYIGSLSLEDLESTRYRVVISASCKLSAFNLRFTLWSDQLLPRESSSCTFRFALC